MKIEWLEWFYPSRYLNELYKYPTSITLCRNGGNPAWIGVRIEDHGTVRASARKLAWRARDGTWHTGPEALDELIECLKDSHNKNRINPSATVSGRLRWTEEGHVVTNCRIILE